MAIQWSVTLSEQQIALLQAISAWELDPTNLEPPKSQQEMMDRPSVGLGFSHFVSHIRPLLRESLVYHETVKWGDRQQFVHNIWGLTAKGEHILAAVELEIEQMKQRHLLGDGLPSNEKARAVRDEVERGNRKRLKERK